MQECSRHGILAPFWPFNLTFPRSTEDGIRQHYRCVKVKSLCRFQMMEITLLSKAIPLVRSTQVISDFQVLCNMLSCLLGYFQMFAKKCLQFERNHKVVQRTLHLNIKWCFLKSPKTSLQTFSDFTFFTRYFSCRSWTSLVSEPGLTRGCFVSLLTKSMVLKNRIVHISDSSHGSNHLQSEAVISGSGWHRRLMTSNVEKVIKGRIQLITPAPVRGRSWEAHTWHEGVRAFPSHSLQ